MKKNKLYIAGGLSLLVIVYIIFQMDWGQVWGTIRTVNPFWVIAALFFHYLTYSLRTLRFKILLGARLSFLKFFGVTQLYGMYLYLMPSKSGEVSFPLLLKEHFNIPLVRGTAVLFSARFLDLLIMALLFPILLIVQWRILSGSLRVLILMISVLVIGFWIVLIWLLRKPKTLVPIFMKADQSKHSAIVKISDISSRVYQELRAIYLNKKLWPSLFLSMGIWIFVQNTLYSLIVSLGFQVTLFQVYVVTLILIPVTLIPLQGFANLGSHELSIVAAFSLFGVSYLDSLNIAIGSHIIYILFSFLLGLTGFLLVRLINKSSPAENIGG